jgi:phosphatidylglycerol:prolipoprotein diacylglycerol transferase
MPWYGLMYVMAFILVWGGIRRWPPKSDLKNGCGRPMELARLELTMIWAMVGLLIGGRLGYVLIYDPFYYFQVPWDIPRLWKGGMSFHGGLLGLILMVRLTAGNYFWPVLNHLALWSPWCLALGRLGNFLKGELWGLPTNMPWGMVFDGAGPLTRHPVQLYEAFFEGPVLGLILLVVFRKGRCRSGAIISGLWAVIYSFFRFCLEFFRQPNESIGYLAGGWLTMGQVLSVILFLVGWQILLGKSIDK